MSSQGPSTGDSSGTGASGCYSNTENSQVPAGYTFSTVSIRDGSDWTAYKKQLLILNERKDKLTSAFPEIKYGNDYRIQYLLGRYKAGGATGCTGCAGDGFNGGVPDS